MSKPPPQPPEHPQAQESPALSWKAPDSKQIQASRGAWGISQPVLITAGLALGGGLAFPWLIRACDLWLSYEKWIWNLWR